MDDDKTTSQTQDEVPAEESAATGNQDLSNVDPRLIVEDEEEEKPEAQVVATEEPETPPEEEQPTAPPEPVTSHRENKRITELTKKLAESNTRQQSPNQPQRTQIIGEGDYDLDQVNGMAQQYGEQRYNEGLQLANSLAFATRLEIAAPKIEARYPALNPQSDEFQAGIADWSTQLYYKAVGLKTKSDGSYTVDNPNIRYDEFVDGLMEAVDTLASSKSADTKQNLAKQAAQTGVRPNSIAKKQYAGDDPNKMTTDQLLKRVNAELGLV